MTIYQQHSEMVGVLAKPGKAILDSMTPAVAHLLHMAVGISGEAAEIFEPIMKMQHLGESIDDHRENLVEELGDLEFYIEGIRLPMNYIPLPQGDELARPVDEDRMSVSAAAGRLVVHAGELLDVVKKVAIYGKQLDDLELQIAWRSVCTDVIRLGQELGISREEALTGNWNKLGERYKGHRYSDQQAQDRADKKVGA